MVCTYCTGAGNSLTITKKDNTTQTVTGAMGAEATIDLRSGSTQPSIYTVGSGLAKWNLTFYF